MKKVLAAILAILMVMVSGCAKKEAGNVKPPQGIAYNKIKFETVGNDELPKEISSKIEGLKQKRGFIYFEDKKNGYTYIAVFMGEKPTGGYSIEVVNVGDSEGRTEVEVKEKSPAPGDIVTQALTYPYTVIRVKGVTPNISVKNTEGEAFKKLN